MCNLSITIQIDIFVANFLDVQFNLKDMTNKPLSSQNFCFQMSTFKDYLLLSLFLSIVVTISSSVSVDKFNISHCGAYTIQQQQ